MFTFITSFIDPYQLDNILLQSSSNISRENIKARLSALEVETEIINETIFANMTKDSLPTNQFQLRVAEPG